MSDQWGTREQPSEEPHQPGVAEHLLLAVGGASLTAAILLAILDNVSHADYIRGLYSVLTGLFVVGIVGWMVRTGQARIRRQVDADTRLICDRLSELTSQVEELRKQVGQAHTVYLPAPRQHQGTRYVGSVAFGEQGNTVPLTPTVNADAEAALRRINMRLVGGDSDPH